MELRNKLRFLGIGLVLLTTLNTGCYYDKVLPPKVETEVSYANDMQPFFDASCTGCHNGTGVPLNLLPDVSYDAIISGGYVNTDDASASNLYVKILPGASMETYASDAERAMTLAWIEQGANNN